MTTIEKKDEMKQVIDNINNDLAHIKVFKKLGVLEEFNAEKIVKAINKSAKRAGKPLTKEQTERILELIKESILTSGSVEVNVPEMHRYVENALDDVSSKIAKSYKDYRNYKKEFADMMDDVYQEAQKIMFIGDKENSNKDSALVSTKGCLIRSKLMKELYQKFFLTEVEKQIIHDGFFYIHDMDLRLLAMNCCLFNISRVLEGGFEMGNIWYNEPKTLDVAFDVIGDIVLSAASQQYGGFTLPRIDSVLKPYAEKSWQIHFDKAMKLSKGDEEASKAFADEELEKEFEQGFQGWEYKFNTVGSSRGDYPFITVTAGLETSKFGILCNKVMYRVHQEGQGKEGHKKPVLFPKYVFLYDEKTNGPESENHEIFDAGLECSSKTMYPDWLSLSGDSYQADMYKKTGEVISPMGCRAFLSPYYEEGGFEPANENDHVIYEGRFNIGAISLNLPLIYLQSQVEEKDFYELLDYYMEIIRDIHCRTYEYLGNIAASTNPLGFCEGGFYGGNLGYDQKIKDNPKILEAATASFGITALNELQQAYNGKSIAEDGAFALEVTEYINKKVDEFKKEDHHLYAIYGTPAENLCGVQIKQIRAYAKENCLGDLDGKIKGVSDREYVSNSFHCHVTEEISPIQKQDLEKRFWHLFKGGEIQYVKYPVDYNKEAMKSLIVRAMDMGFYEGVNLSLAYCDNCGHEELEMDACPCCGSKNITKIDRMNGYLSYSRVKGDTRLNAAKMAEVTDRISM